MANEMAHLYLQDPGGDLVKADKFCRDSLELDPEQQRAYHNLGWLEMKKPDWREACRQFENALQHTRWQMSDTPDHTAAIRYNYACAISRRLASPQPGEPLPAADLIQAGTTQLFLAARGAGTKAETWDEDRQKKQKEGDLFTLWSAIDAQAQAEIEAAFRSAWAGNMQVEPEGIAIRAGRFVDAQLQRMTPGRKPS